MKTNTLNLETFWREGLYQALASEMGSVKASKLCEEFDKLTDAKMSGEGAANIIAAAHSNQKPRIVAKTIKEWVEKELGTFNASHQGIDTNGRSRFINAVRTINANIDKCAVLIDGVELDKVDIEKIKARIPAALKSPVVYQAVASDGTKFLVEVKI